MKAYEITPELTNDGKLNLPKDLYEMLLKQQPDKLILMIANNQQNNQWETLTTEQFLAGYSEEDSIYNCKIT